MEHFRNLVHQRSHQQPRTSPPYVHFLGPSRGVQGVEVKKRKVALDGIPATLRAGAARGKTMLLLLYCSSSWRQPARRQPAKVTQTSSSWGATTSPTNQSSNPVGRPGLPRTWGRQTANRKEQPLHVVHTFAHETSSKNTSPKRHPRTDRCRKSCATVDPLPLDRGIRAPGPRQTRSSNDLIVCRRHAFL